MKAKKDRTHISPNKGIDSDKTKIGFERSAPWLLVFGFISFYLWHALYLRNIFENNLCDDAYISFRYIHQWVNGHGLSYNPGERVEGFSNLLWMLLLVPVEVCGGDIRIAAQWLGALLGCGAMVVALLSVRSLFGSRSILSVVFIGGLLSSSGYFASWTLSGMETALEALLLVLAWWRYHAEERNSGFPVSGILFGLLAATRPEGLLIVGGMAFFHVFRTFVFNPKTLGKRRLGFWVALLSPVLAFEIFRLSYYGLFLWPNSVQAKVGLGQETLIRGYMYVVDNFVNPYVLLLLPLGAIWSLRKSYPLITGMGLFTGLIAVVVVSGGDWSSGRFFAPILPLGTAVFVGACTMIFEKIGSAKGALAQGAAVLATFVFLGYAFHSTSVQREQVFNAKFASLDSERIRLGKWLKRYAPPQTKVALLAAGQICYYSDLYCHDMLGLNDKHIGSLKVELGNGLVGHEKSDANYTLNVIRPDIIVQAQFIPGMMRRREFQQRFAILPGWAHGVWITRPLFDYLSQHKGALP